MRLPKSMTVSAAEAFIADIAQGRADTVQVPTRGNHQATGGEAAFVQALITWAAGRASAKLASYATGPDDEVQIERLTRRLYGLAGCLVADEIVGVRGVQLTEVLQRHALARLDELQDEAPTDASRGAQLEIVCVDHLARSCPSSVYTHDGEGVASVKELPAFNALAEGLVKEVVPGGLARTLDPDLVPAIGGALHELFRNTEEHGRIDDNGDVPTKSIRGFQARRHPINPEALVALSAQSPPLERYCRRLRPARRDNRDVQLIEIAVFDSGPGMASSLAGMPLAKLDPDAERDLVVSCFRESVSRKRLSSAGLGLPTVVDLLRERKGFLRLRTGRTALYSDLSLEADSAFGAEPDLQDWFGDRIEGVPVVGTLFTLLFPLEA